MGADIFESFVGSIIVMIIAEFGTNAALCLLPILLGLLDMLLQLSESSLCLS